MNTYRADLETKDIDRRWRIIKYASIGAGVLLLIGLILAALVWHKLFNDMPKLPVENDTLWTIEREGSLEFVSEDGTLLSVRGPVYGRAVDLKELPDYVSQAFIAGEDQNFYKHNGVDNSAILRAAIANVRAGSTVQGGSTLTQQLVKNLFLSSARTMERKAQEMRLALALEKRLSKEQILTLYLNRIYLGNRSFGIDGASRAYFDKTASELTLAEAALLAGLPKAPSRLDPSRNFDGAKVRQLYVLNRMVDAGFISEETAEAAREEEIQIAEAFQSNTVFGYALDMATDRLGEILPDEANDLVVTLTIDPKIQLSAQKILTETLTSEGAPLNATSGAFVMMDTSGKVKSVVGGTDYSETQFNRVTQAQRQPGSAFKTFVFAAALEYGFDPFSVRIDAPIEIDGWSPGNYSGRYSGRVTLAEALEESINTIAAQVADEIGQEKVVALAQRFGISSDMKPLPSIALGSDEVTLYDMTRAYGAFANNGYRLDPYLISKVEDSRGNILFERKDYEPHKVYPDNLTQDMNAMLSRVVQVGTGKRAIIPNWDVAGKTGTSQEWRDAWFVGYTSSLVAGVWLGNDDDSPMEKVTGGTLPAQIWQQIMVEALQNDQPGVLAGADALILSDEDEERLSFYRDLAAAFGSVEPREIASVTDDFSRQ